MPSDTRDIVETPAKSTDTGHPGGGDPLSLVLRRLRLRARVFLRADYCGNWAVDTSGDRNAPFHLVTHGTGWLHEPGRPPQPLTAGDLVVFPHDARHTLSDSDAPPDPALLNQGPTQSDGPSTGLLCGYFTFDRRAGGPLLDGLPATIVLDLTEASRRHDTASLIQLWMTEAAGDAPGRDAAIDQLAYVVFIHILREQIRRGEVRGPLEALTDPAIGPVLNDIHARPGDTWSVDGLAARAGLSRSAFAERFRSRVGMTPARYLTHWRMQAAIDLLENTRLSVAEIADRSGYASEVAFRKAFRKQVGEPPGRVRRAAAGRMSDG